MYCQSCNQVNISFSNWKRFMQSRETGDLPKIDSWVTGNFTYDKQSDAVSCGILCLMFLEKIIIHNSKEFKFTSETNKISKIRVKIFNN